MTCTTASCGFEYPFSLAGRVIGGRSTPAFDKRIKSQPIYYREEQMSMDHTMAPPSVVSDYYGYPLTPTEQRLKHYGAFGYGDLPIKESPNYYGRPLSEEQRLQRHYAIYGTTDLPPRGTGRGVGLGMGIQKLVVDWGSVLGGAILGLVLGYFVFTASGRRVGYQMGRRAARKLR